MRSGLLVRDPVVEAALHGHLTDLSVRSVQRRFLRATGLTQSAIRQIERARAAALLEHGVSIFDTLDQAGYVDQPASHCCSGGPPRLYAVESRTTNQSKSVTL